MKKLFGLGVVLILMSSSAWAQHKIAYIDSDRIYQNYPEFTTAQQSLDRLAQQWEQDLAERLAALEDKFEEYQARELLYTSESRQEKQNEIIAEEEEIERMRMQYFGPEGQLFHQQEQILRPIQEKVLTVIQEIAEAEGYDYVFDRNGDFVFLYANESLDITDLVLEELGVDITRIIGQ
ncbi:MAG: OmpH family outer membrane protein [Rhodothermaceae bacterium]|nr:OmpH family outer membrane protein [Rhodothermaceae bacterium]MYI84358.1 OmpH family outer membrane protein [Rhodothermaceae bacterium]